MKIFTLILILSIILIPTLNFASNSNSNIILLGDVNNDGRINSTDAVPILRHNLAITTGKHSEWILQGNKLKTADVNQDNKINSSDVVRILRHIATGNAEILKKHPEWIIEGNVNIEVTDIILNNTQLTLEKGKTAQLGVKILPENATNKTILFKSLNPQIATINASNGTITAKSGGTTKIMVSTLSGKIVTCTVNVVVPETGIKLSETTKLMEKGKTYQLKATITPDDATNKTITWSSSNTNIVSVDKNGIAKAVDFGTATITAKTSNGKIATCKATVDPDIIPAILIDNTTKNASTSTSSSSTSKSTNSSTNKSTSSSASKSTKSTSSNSKKIKATGIKIENSYNNKIEVGSEKYLSATVYPSNATNKEISWTASNTNIVSIQKENNTRIKIKGKKAGNATITATLKESGISAKYNIVVKEKNIPVKDILLNKNDLKLVKGTKYKLTVTIKPSNATDKTIKWSSGDTRIATVDKNGQVTAKGVGTTKIYAKCGNISKICKVTVSMPTITKIQIYSQDSPNDSILSMKRGKTRDLSAIAEYSDGTKKKLSNTRLQWYSSHNLVAIVKNGRITALKEGYTNIGAKMNGITTNSLTVRIGSK